MIELISSSVKGDVHMIAARAKIVTNEDYKSLLKRYCDEIVKFGLKKIVIDETKVEYQPSLLLQMDIVEFYSSGELPEEFKTWKIACVGSTGSKVYYEFWADLSQRSGYEQQTFDSIESANEWLSR